MLRARAGTSPLAFAALFGAVLLPGPEAAGQAALGAQLSLTEHSTDETSWAPGLRVLLEVPLTGLAVQGTYDLFRQPCDPGICQNGSVGFALLWSFPLPLLADPYLGVGVAPELAEGWRLDWGGETTGMYAVAGLRLGGTGFGGTQFFAEAKHAFRGRQLFISAGFLFFLF
jgi:hypothetical protein